MEYFTHATIKAKVQRALDLEDEIFITPTELLDYHNEAIDECEAEIHTLYEDYFLSNAAISLVSGTQDYDLPSDIFANKIRAIIYHNGATIYPVKKLKSRDMFAQLEVQEQYNTTDWYKYLIINNAAQSAPQIRLTPSPNETTSNALQIYYIRNANKMTEDASICDIPEFSMFIYNYMKMKCYEKEGHPNLQMAVQIVEHQRNLMRDTLSRMAADGDTEIEADLTFYEEST